MNDRPLTETQERLLAGAVAAHRDEPRRVQEARYPTKERVLLALEVGVPAAVLADALGVSRARVYQIRDEAIAEDPWRADPRAENATI